MKKLTERLGKLWKDWGYPLFLILVVSCIARSSLADWNDVPTGSMNPTILEGDRVWVNKLAYDLKVPFTRIRVATWSQPERGDVVVFFSPQDGTRMIKRVVGLPGDRITMRRNRLNINGEPVAYESAEEDLLARLSEPMRQRNEFAVEQLGEHKHPVMATPQARSIRFFGPVEVPEDHYLMLGDNRDNSHDSRYFGFVPTREIVGRASAVVLSFDHENWWKPRWGRFFSALP